MVFLAHDDFEGELFELAESNFPHLFQNEIYRKHAKNLVRFVATTAADSCSQKKLWEELTELSLKLGFIRLDGRWVKTVDLFRARVRARAWRRHGKPFPDDAA